MNNTRDFLYFKQLLTENLQESFPLLAEDTKLINQRARWAFSAYEGALSGENPESECLKIAKAILFEGLHFSKFDTLVDVLRYEFSHILKENQLRPAAIKVLPLCEKVFARYNLTDDFLYNIEHDQLYRELKETIAKKLKENGIQ